MIEAMVKLGIQELCFLSVSSGHRSVGCQGWQQCFLLVQAFHSLPKSLVGSRVEPVKKHTLRLTKHRYDFRPESFVFLKVAGSLFRLSVIVVSFSNGQEYLLGHPGEAVPLG